MERVTTTTATPPLSLPAAEAETIYNLLPRLPVPAPKPLPYRAVRLRLARRLPPVGSSFGCAGGAHVLGNGRVEKRVCAQWGPQASRAADPKVRKRGGGEGRGEA